MGNNPTARGLLTGELVLQATRSIRRTRALPAFSRDGTGAQRYFSFPAETIDLPPVDCWRVSMGGSFER